MRLHSILALFILLPVVACFWEFTFPNILGFLKKGINRNQKPDILDKIDLNCKGLLEEDKSSLVTLAEWKYDRRIEDEILNAPNQCAKLRELFNFNPHAMSDEESDFPLAYGLVVYTDPTQLLFMLNSFYHPQNLYCLAVSGSADEKFKEIVKILPNCFENIHVMMRPPISWGSYEILNSTYACVEYLSLHKNKWRYYQYLSGSDVPLKTNLEMVKIFKALKDKPNFEICELEKDRIDEVKMASAPLPIFKSSLSPLIPRRTANFLVKSNMTRQVLDFLNGTIIPDESFWATVLGNVKIFPVPGALDAAEILQARKEIAAQNRKLRHEPIRWSYYISREQVWKGQSILCRGTFKSDSCVFGVRDLANLMKQPPLVGHKLYLRDNNYQPAALFCAFKEIRRRTFDPEPFDVFNYTLLPQYELMNGIPVQNLSNPIWL